jgi:hypothetical protein
LFQGGQGERFHRGYARVLRTLEPDIRLKLR